MTEASFFESMTDAEIVDLLKKQNHPAWDYVFAQAGLPVLKKRHIRGIMRDRQLSNLDVYGLLYDEMNYYGKIHQYKGGSVMGWIKLWVWGLVHRYCKKNPYSVSDEEASNALISMKAPEPKTEMREIADRCFRELWQEAPLRAYVLELKLNCNLSAREIKDLLNLSSEDNVNQLFSRALKDMKRLRRKYENE